MKQLFELCLRAFETGTDNYGEKPLPFGDDAWRIIYEPVNPDAIYFDGAVDYPKIIKGESYFTVLIYTESCAIGVGVYPYDDGKRIYFVSGQRVFDVEVTPEIHEVFDKAIVDHYKIIREAS